MKKIVACILMVLLITSSLFISVSAQEEWPSADDYFLWISGAVQDINTHKIGDPTNPYNDFLKEMNITQATRSLGQWINSFGQKIKTKNIKIDDEIISMLVGLKYAIRDIDGCKTDEVAAAIAAFETDFNISYEKAGNKTYTDTLKGFSDLENHAWAKEGIEDMSVGNYKGLFSGTTLPDENGMATFSPDEQMTRAEFISVVTRMLFAEELADMPAVNDGLWYKNNYRVAIHHNIINSNEYALDADVLNAPMPRQEMALILLRACNQKGETTTLASSKKIADYDTIDDAYRNAVLNSYAKGLLTGVDEKGTFAPHQTLTRAEAATVLYRLVNPLKRVLSDGGLVQMTVIDDFPFSSYIQ